LATKPTAKHYICRQNPTLAINMTHRVGKRPAGMGKSESKVGQDLEDPLFKLFKHVLSSTK